MAKKWKNLFEYYGFTEKEAKKYPIVSRILKKLTPERIKKENEKIQKIKLPPEIQKWANEYKKVGERSDYIWKWLYKMFQFVYLPGVLKTYQKSLWRDKVLITMFVAQLDDAADKLKKKALLKELLKIPEEEKISNLQRFKKKEKKYLKFTLELWKEIITHIKKYPRYQEFREIFYYDINQVLNAISYSFLVNKNPYLINKSEYWHFLSYNMVSFLYSDVDLMCFSEINLQNIGKFREAIYYAQKMARVGNWLSTWERELKERDITSGVVAYALDRNMFSIKDLTHVNTRGIIKKIKKGKIEKKFLKEWNDFYLALKKIGREMKEKKFIDKYLLSLEKLLTLHLISRGYK